jgi:hypothetical protein
LSFYFHVAARLNKFPLWPLFCVGGGGGGGIKIMTFREPLFKEKQAGFKHAVFNC